MDELEQKHRKELKELTANITKMKKSASNKQMKKQVQEEIILLETEIKARHNQEKKELLAQIHTDSNDVDIPSQLEELSLEDQKEPTVTKRPNKAKRRKEKKLAEFERQREEAALEAQNLPDMKEMETRAIQAVLSPLKLQVQEITADGHCMYNAIADQLLLGRGEEYTYNQLRKMAADYILGNQEDFLPFLVDENGEMLSADDLEGYCNKVAYGAVWGGNNELQALSQVLKCQIHVFQADSPVVKLGENYNGTVLSISYHKHAYGLGEHYNSLHPNSA